MSSTKQFGVLALALSMGLGLSACVTNSAKDGDAAPSQAATSDKTSSTRASAGVPPGMNANGEVVDSSLVEAGHGRTVKGKGDWEGEITGKPFPGAKFQKLQIGMPMKQVTDLVGEPTDQGAYMTGKAWIPFYFGSDRYRHELVYKGQGRLIFAGGSVGDIYSGHLTWIIYNRNEGGYR